MRYTKIEIDGQLNPKDKDEVTGAVTVENQASSIAGLHSWWGVRNRKSSIKKCKVRKRS